MKVSILVPVYGVEAFIGKCARTLFEQDYANIEYVFVNDCTKDRSIEVILETLKEYPHRESQVKIVNHEQNMGLSMARNTAVAHSSGDFLIPVDSDDYLSSPTAVSELMRLAVKNDADVVFYDMQLIYPTGSSVLHTNMPEDYKELTRKVLRRELSLTIWGGLYKRKLFTDYGIKSIKEISMGEDYVVKARLAYYMRKIVYCNQPFYCYNQTNVSAITRRFKSSWIDDMEACMRIVKDFFVSKPDYDEFKEDVSMGAVRGKLSLFPFCAFYGGTSADFKRIENLFPDDIVSCKSLGGSEKIVYFLAKYHLKRILKAYIYSGVKLKSLLRLLLIK